MVIATAVAHAHHALIVWHYAIRRHEYLAATQGEAGGDGLCFGHDAYALYFYGDA